MKRYILIAVGAIALLFVLIQLVPYGRSHDNPPVAQEFNWDSSASRDIAQRACYDCHSNESVWPWYSNIAPVSWLVQNHVDEGREELNFSAWNTQKNEVDEIGEVILEGEMPPQSYLLNHPEARLTDAEKAQLIRAVETNGR